MTDPYETQASQAAGKVLLLVLVACLAAGCAAPGTRRPHALPQAARQAASRTPSGQAITPTAAPGARFATLDPGLKRFPAFRANQAVTTTISPDGQTLLVLTSGYNQIFGPKSIHAIPAYSNQYVFVYDISHGTPRQTQVLKLPATYMGIAFAPDGRHFYVAGGDDDDVHVFAHRRGRWAEQGRPIKLGHLIPAGGWLADKGGVGLHVGPEAAGLAVAADGRTLVVANYYNDSLSLVDLRTRKVRDVPLRPGVIDPTRNGVAGGEYPLWVALRGKTAYVSSQRDREIDVVRVGRHPQLLDRIAVKGNPNRMVLDRDGGRLYVACDNEANVAVIDTATRKVIDNVNVTAPATLVGAPTYVHGTVPDSLALSPDGTRLYVSDGGTNAVAVVALKSTRPEVTALIPTGYYPNSISVGHDGRHLYIVNGKSVPGPNPNNCSRNKYDRKRDANCRARNDYILQLSHAGLLTLPVPDAETLEQLTHLVAHNNHFRFRENAADRAMMAFLHRHIHHIIYVVRENRSYDQILGDLGEGNSDPELVEFGKTITPNAHRLAHAFGDLDNFYDTGEVSGNGWAWSTAARESDAGEKNVPINYAFGGLSYDWEGDNRNVNVALPTLAARRKANPHYPHAPNLLPGQNDVGAPDGPRGQKQKGYLWDAALRAGLSVRNYGFFIDLDNYDYPPSRGGTPLATNPAAQHLKVAVSANPTLAPRTDPYFRGFDNRMPDYYREAEWAREFGGYVQHHDLPSLELVRLMHDHLGNFDDAINGVDTPNLEVADNDYAVGKLIQDVAHSPYAGSTLIFVVEDDAQDGPDHVDAHRSEAFIVGPYVRHRAVIGDRYTTVNMIRTIEDILGFGPMTLNDAYERPMASVFDRDAAAWSYNAVEPRPLTATQLPQSAQAKAMPRWHRIQPASWWAARTRGYDWHVEDDIPTVAFDHLLWKGAHPDRPYPAVPGVDSSDQQAPRDGD